jgi:hypothetical protein
VNAARRALVAGAALAVIGLAIAGRPYAPLYDGVISAEPYKYLDPGPGQPGQPPTATATIKIVDGGSDLIAVATGESVPQAQIFVIPGGLAIVPGTTRIDVSIAAVEPRGQPTDGHIAGNVYAINVTNDAGLPIAAKADAQATVELRAPDQSTQTATIERFDGTSWQPLPTTAAGLAALFTAVVTQFGEFAIVLPGGAATPAASGAVESPGASQAVPSIGPAPSAAASPPEDRGTLTLILGGAAGLVVLLVAALALLPSRGTRPPPGRSAGGTRRRPKDGRRRP